MRSRESEEPDEAFEFDLSSFLDGSPEADELAKTLVDAMRTPLGPNDPRRHHYIPQFFLKRFADGERLARVRLDAASDPQIAVVKDLAVIKDLYTTIDVEVGETVAVERLLAHVDGAAAGALDRLAFGALFPPSLTDRFALGLWMAMLHTRSPARRRKMEAVADQAMKLQFSLITDEQQAAHYLARPLGREPTDDEVKDLMATLGDLDHYEFTPHQNEMVVMMLRGGQEATPHFLNRNWTVMKFDEPGLVLPDRPLFFYQAPENRAPYRGVSVGNADEIWMPLDRRTALILHHDEVVGEAVMKAPPGYTVDDFNAATVRGTDAEIFCHPDDVESLANLDLPDANRPLLAASVGWPVAAIDGINEPPTRKKHHRYRRTESSPLTADTGE